MSEFPAFLPSFINSDSETRPLCIALNEFKEEVRAQLHSFCVRLPVAIILGGHSSCKCFQALLPGRQPLCRTCIVQVKLAAGSSWHANGQMIRFQAVWCARAAQCYRQPLVAHSNKAWPTHPSNSNDLEADHLWIRPVNATGF